MASDQVLREKLAERAARFEELSRQLEDPAVAADAKRFPALLRERGVLEESARLHASWSELAQRIEEAEAILAEGESELAELAEAELGEARTSLVSLAEEARTALVADPEDERRRVIVEIRAGTGGDEATLFAADLFRMYGKLADARRWRLESMGEQASDVGGLREIVFGVEGDGAWRALRFESGGHRVQRVPATESQGRIHTSAATVAVMAEAEDAEIELRDEDLDVDTMRAGGAGGQHVNKTESAVRITHRPSGIVVVCQDERSQHKNRARALRILRARLLEAERDRLHAERSEMRRTLVGSGDRSQRVRTYNFPQNRVTDHRLEGDVKSFSLEQVVEGRLDALLAALEEAEREERLKAL